VARQTIPGDSVGIQVPVGRIKAGSGGASHFAEGWYVLVS
jgi:hypothetical protein